jgi:hypothetical protein
VRRLKDGTLVANSGSIGLPADDETGCYLLLDLEGPQALFRTRRFAFDRQAVFKAAKEAGSVIEKAFVERS